jgi:hypothetical protein
MDPGAMQAMHALPTDGAGVPPSEVAFPYGFPSPGDYRVFVQIKRAGKIETGVFDARIK